MKIHLVDLNLKQMRNLMYLILKD